MPCASIKIDFQVAGKNGLSLQEFLEAFDISLSAEQIEDIRKYLTAFCFSVVQENCYSYEEDFSLTVYLRSLIGINDQGEWFVTPLKGMKMFFHGLRVICIYHVTYYPSGCRGEYYDF